MSRKLIIILCLLYAATDAIAQHSPEDCYNKYMELTKMFRGDKPYACNAIVFVKYKLNAANSDGDTSRLIYKNKLTYYKSPLVENIDAPEGQLTINHELKTAVFNISDSIKRVLQKELNMKPDEELESMLDDNFEKKDLEAFKQYVLIHCQVEWNTENGVHEITFYPKRNDDAVFIAVTLRFNSKNQVVYYQYVNSDVYSTDFNGKKKIRYVTTVYDNFKHDNIPDIPARLSDYLQWNGWDVKLKKYTNYKFSLL